MDWPDEAERGGVPFSLITALAQRMLVASYRIQTLSKLFRCFLHPPHLHLNLYSQAVPSYQTSPLRKVSAGFDSSKIKSTTLTAWVQCVSAVLMQSVKSATSRFKRTNACRTSDCQLALHLVLTTLRASYSHSVPGWQRDRAPAAPSATLHPRLCSWPQSSCSLKWWRGNLKVR